MEEKLFQLKEQFCNWYCEGKHALDEHEETYICNECQLYEYIRFVRDELSR